MLQLDWSSAGQGMIVFWHKRQSYFSGMNLSVWLGHFPSHSDSLLPVGSPRAQILAYFCSHFDSTAEHLRSFIQEVISISMTNTWRLLISAEPPTTFLEALLDFLKGI